MHALTEADLRASFVNAHDDELARMSVPVAFAIVDWDHADFFGWADRDLRGRAYLVADVDGVTRAIVLRRANGSSHVRAALCNICHTMQPGDQVALFSARRAGESGRAGDSIGTYLCVDISCHESVRLAAPLAPQEVRASVDVRIDGARRRAENFIRRIVEGT